VENIYEQQTHQHKLIVQHEHIKQHIQSTMEIQVAVVHVQHEIIVEQEAVV
jgi:hypothetical protein